MPRAPVRGQEGKVRVRHETVWAGCIREVVVIELTVRAESTCQGGEG